ncbi:hypothetical protein B0J14DRAFT_49431 [Halenospora varia]|nr:hypothetical protein B0J14DRAFT_49431 [Halenospora varia]
MRISTSFSTLLLLGITTRVASQNSSIIQTIDPFRFATNPNATLPTNPSTPSFQIFNSKFNTILGSNPSISLIIEDSLPLFHEAGVITSLNPPVIWATSNQYNLTSPSSNSTTKVTTISKISQAENGSWIVELITPSPEIPFVNGGFRYKDGILFAAQGSLTEDGGLTLMSTAPPYNTSIILNSYYGIPFASPNDVFVTQDGSVWFTDNPVGFPQGIRPAPEIGGATYRFVPGTTELRIVNDDFANPNGITFSPDEKTAYVTAMDGLLSNDLTGKRMIYAFDVSYPQSSSSSQAGISSSSERELGQPYLTNKRLFARVSSGIPDGIKFDTEGNLWVGDGGELVFMMGRDCSWGGS